MKMVKKMRRVLRQGAERDGQSLVEFSFTAVLIIGLLIFMVGFAIVAYSYITITSMAREGTSYLTRHATVDDDEVIKNYMKARAGVLNRTEPSPMRIIIEPNAANIADRVPGGPLAVTVYYDVPLPVVSLPYIINPGRMVVLPPITLKALSKGRFEGEVSVVPTAGTVFPTATNSGPTATATRSGPTNTPTSVPATATPTPTPPAAPSGLDSPAKTNTTITIGWTDNSDNEDGFIIERQKKSGVSWGSWQQIATVGASSTFYVTFKDTGLTKNTNYNYRVKAYNSAGSSGWSNEKSVKTLNY
jgi:Flp pilus assembly protein TadG